MRAILIIGAVVISFSSEAQNRNNKRISKLLNKGKEEKALALANKTLRKDENAFSYHLRGYYFSLKGESELAIADYNKSIELDPSYSQAYFDRGYSYFLSGESQKAIADYSKTIQLETNYAEAYLNRGTVKFEQGDDRGACSDWSTAASLGLDFANEIITANCQN